MSQAVGDFLVERLHAWGVRKIFGYPGDGINGVLSRAQSNPEFNASEQIPNVPYHKFGELIGLKGIYVDRPEALGAAWEEALAADRPVVLEVKTDPEVPPLPPHITFEEAKHLTETLGKGDPHERSVIVETAKQVFASLVPGK